MERDYKVSKDGKGIQERRDRGLGRRDNKNDHDAICSANSPKINKIIIHRKHILIKNIFKNKCYLKAQKSQQKNFNLQI